MTRTKTRTLANLPNNTVSVKDFGAVGDGVVNDSPAIKEALQWLFSEVESQKSLYVPSGIYNLEQTVVIDQVNPKNSQLAIYGDGATSVFHCNDPNGGIKINGFAPAIYLTLDGLQFCPGTGNGGTAFAFWYTYDNINTKNRHGIWMRDCVVDTLVAENFVDGWIDVFKFHGASRVKIQDTTVWNYWWELDDAGDPVGKMFDLTDCYNPWMEDVYCNGAGKYGVYNVRGAFNEGGNFSNINIVGPSIGLYINQSDEGEETGRHPGVWIRNAHMNCAAINIHVEKCSYVLIQNNLFYGLPREYDLPGSPSFIDIYTKDSRGINIINNSFGSGSLEVMDRRHVYVDGTSNSIHISDNQLDASCQQQPFYFKPEAFNVTVHQPTAPSRNTYFKYPDGTAAPIPTYLTQGAPSDSTYVYKYEVYSTT